MVQTGVDSVSSAADLIVRGKHQCLSVRWFVFNLINLTEHFLLEENHPGRAYEHESYQMDLTLPSDRPEDATVRMSPNSKK